MTLDAAGNITIKRGESVVIIDKKGRILSLARNGELAVIDAEGREREIHKVPYGTVLMHQSGDKVSQGERLAEWDPFTTPVITDKPDTMRQYSHSS